MTERNERGSNQNRKADDNTEYDINLLNERSYLQQHIEPVWLESEINLPVKNYSIRLYGTRRPIKDYSIQRAIRDYGIQRAIIDYDLRRAIKDCGIQRNEENYYINSILDEDHSIFFCRFAAIQTSRRQPIVPGRQPIDADNDVPRKRWWWWWKSTND